MSELINDFRYATRVLLKTPRFSVTVILTLAIGIGVNVAIFSIVNAFLIRPLPFAEPDELVHLWRSDPKRGFEHLRYSLPTIEKLEQRAESFSGMGFYNYRGGNLASGDAEPESLTIGRLSRNLLPLLGVEAAHGRIFLPENVDGAEDDRVVLLSWGLWQRRFGGDTGIVGRTVDLDEVPTTVVGVMPREFNFPFGGVKAWEPVDSSDPRWDSEYRNFMPVARLATGVARQQAGSEVEGLYAAIRGESYPDDTASVAVVEPLRTSLIFLFDILSMSMVLLTVAAGFVLLIICTNIANLFLVRAIGREREVAVRAAIGAGRAPLVRQLLAEGVVLALVGGGLGAFLAGRLLELAKPSIAEDIFRVGEIGVDGPALAFTLVVSLVTVFIFALPPALQTLKADLTLSLKDGSSAALGSVKARRSQSFLVVSQISLAAVLLIGTALALRSFTKMQDVDPGFRPANVLTLDYVLPSASYPESEQVGGFNRGLLERIESLAGVESAALVRPLPLNFESWGREFLIEGVDEPGGERHFANEHYVSSGYFSTMGIPLLEGRDFDQRDTGSTQPVIVVNRSLADRHWSNRSPVGQRLRMFDDGEETVATVIGVVGDTKQIFLNDDSDTQIYLPQAQHPLRSNFVVVRTRAEPLGMTAEVRDQFRALHPGLPLTAIRSMDQVVEESLRPWSWSAVTLGAFSLFALLLAGIGIYGVVAYAVYQRTGEIGVRMALGAEPFEILSLVLKKALTLAAIGVTVGGVAAFALSRAMSSVLYGVGASDPLTYATVLLVLAGVAVVAAMAPAVRASRVHPGVALRYE